MTDRPLIFSDPMIRALLDGRKTQTRRIIRGVGNDNCMTLRKATTKRTGLRTHVIDAGNYGLLPYTVGDRLWVRETWQPHSLYADRAPRNIPPSIVFYKADGGHSPSLPWKPGIHMPRWASRLTLVVTDVRVQRLQGISEADAIAEGLVRGAGAAGWVWSAEGMPGDLWRACPRQTFSGLWNRINGLGAWDANPWVTAISFDVHRCNIDRMGA
jgi:hypothetical protein